MSNRDQDKHRHTGNIRKKIHDTKEQVKEQVKGKYDNHTAKKEHRNQQTPSPNPGQQHFAESSSPYNNQTPYNSQPPYQNTYPSQDNGYPANPGLDQVGSGDRALNPPRRYEPTRPFHPQPRPSGPQPIIHNPGDNDPYN